MYTLYFKSYEYECQIIIIDVQAIYHIRYFLQKGELASRSLLSEGRYFRGVDAFGIFANTCDILSLLSGGEGKRERE